MSAHTFDPKRDHTISQAEAAKLVQAFQRVATQGEHLSTVFNRSAFEKILAQSGCEGIRIYRATHEEGTQTLVMVGVDAAGNDLAGIDRVFAQAGQNCPPFCAPLTWL